MVMCCSAVALPASFVLFVGTRRDGLCNANPTGTGGDLECAGPPLEQVPDLVQVFVAAFCPFVVIRMLFGSFRKEGATPFREAIVPLL